MNNLDSVQRDMLSLLSCALSGREAQPVSVDNWPAVLEELKKQAVHVLVADQIQQLGLTAEETNAYLQLTGVNLRIFHELMMDQQAVIQLLNAADISAVVLKGAAAAVYYPVPEYRCMGDIDIIVPPNQFDKAFELLCQSGYQKEQELADVGRHAEFQTATGAKIELHRYFSSSGNAVQDKSLNDAIYNGIENLTVQNIHGYSVPMLPAPENGLVLLSHINQHLSGGIGLRQIADWMLYVRRELPDEQWERFCPMAEAIGMRKLAETTTYMCKKYLNLSGISWCDSADDGLADELMEYILDNGNFGRKYSTGSRTTMSVMHKFRNPVSAFRYLTDGGMCHWKAAQKHKWLKMFAWIYQIGHLIRMGLKRDVKFDSFANELEQSHREADLLTRLGVTRL